MAAATVKPPEASALPRDPVKVLFTQPIAINGEVFTFVDVIKDKATLVAMPHGVMIDTGNKPSKRGKSFFVPYANILALQYTVPGVLPQGTTLTVPVP